MTLCSQANPARLPEMTLHPDASTPKTLETHTAQQVPTLARRSTSSPPSTGLCRWKFISTPTPWNTRRTVTVVLLPLPDWAITTPSRRCRTAKKATHHGGSSSSSSEFDQRRLLHPWMSMSNPNIRFKPPTCSSGREEPRTGNPQKYTEILLATAAPAAAPCGVQGRIGGMQSVQTGRMRHNARPGAMVYIHGAAAAAAAAAVVPSQIIVCTPGQLCYTALAGSVLCACRACWNQPRTISSCC